MNPEQAFYRAFPYMKERILADPKLLGEDWFVFREDAIRIRDDFLQEMSLPPNRHNHIVIVSSGDTKMQIQTGRLRPYRIGNSVALFKRRGPNSVTFVDSFVVL